MAKARWPHPVILYEAEELLWCAFKTHNPGVSFSGLCRTLLLVYIQEHQPALATRFGLKERHACTDRS